MKESIVGEEPAGGANGGANKPRNDNKILDCNWDYEFLKGESEYIIV